MLFVQALRPEERAQLGSAPLLIPHGRRSPQDEEGTVGSAGELDVAALSMEKL